MSDTNITDDNDGKATLPKKKRLTKKQKEEIKEALFKADIVNVAADDDYLLVVRVGTDEFPTNIEQLRIVNNYLNKLRKDGFIPEVLKTVTVAHNVEFTREALANIEWLSDDPNDEGVIID